MGKKKPMVIRVTKEEFELDDGRIFPHMLELDEVPSVEEFQETYDHWREVFKDVIRNE
jgi:hypothetical protein